MVSDLILEQVSESAHPYHVREITGAEDGFVTVMRVYYTWWASNTRGTKWFYIVCSKQVFIHSTKI